MTLMVSMEFPKKKEVKTQLKKNKLYFLRSVRTIFPSYKLYTNCITLITAHYKSTTYCIKNTTLDPYPFM